MQKSIDKKRQKTDNESTATTPTKWEFSMQYVNYTEITSQISSTRKQIKALRKAKVPWTDDSHYNKIAILEDSLDTLKATLDNALGYNRVRFPNDAVALKVKVQYIRKCNYHLSQINQNSWDCGRQDAFGDSVRSEREEWLERNRDVKRYFEMLDTDDFLARKASDNWLKDSHYRNLKRRINRAIQDVIREGL